MSFELNWERLLSKQRPAGTVAPSGGSLPVRTAATGPRSDFEQDYDRVIFSAPFRRLAGKTQVHPFAQIDHVHNRLTHTLEVASVGRSLAAKVGHFLETRKELPKEVTTVDLGFVVQAACLARDMGNPPFGHAGEYAFRGWAKDHLAGLLKGKIADAGMEAVLADWSGFEGNAQSFRLVSRSDKNERDYFRFTYASLGAMIKYPWTSDDARTANHLEKKHNVFSSEQAVFLEMAGALGLLRPDGRVARHPLSFLSEAADDICYRISDFEDAVEMGILKDAEVRGIFCRIAGDVAEGPISALRAKVIGRLIDEMARVFEEDYAAIMAGERMQDLKATLPEEMRAAMKEIKEGYQTIFGHRRKVAVELGAHSILGRILDGYVRAVVELTELGGDYQKLGFVHKRTLELAWETTFISKNKHQPLAWWLGRVMDHVAGMTDAYATQVSREIAGG